MLRATQIFVVIGVVILCFLGLLEFVANYITSSHSWNFPSTYHLNDINLANFECQNGYSVVINSTDIPSYDKEMGKSYSLRIRVAELLVKLDGTVISDNTELITSSHSASDYSEAQDNDAFTFISDQAGTSTLSKSTIYQCLEQNQSLIDSLLEFKNVFPGIRMYLRQSNLPTYYNYDKGIPQITNDDPNFFEFIHT